PDALSLFVHDERDVRALHELRAAFDVAADRLPLVVCVPADSPHIEDVARAADMVSLSTAGAPLDRALEIAAHARRPVLLEAAPQAEDGALAVDRAVDRVLEAVAVARGRGCRDVALSVAARDTSVLITTYRRLAERLDERGDALPLHLVAWPAGNRDEVLLRASVALGALLCDGIGDSIQILGATKGLGDQQRARLAFNVLQGAGVRLSKTEFVACPSCGRTLFNLQETTERIQRQTGHLKGVKIAIMGCIVNGPGEMADADFGYVGGAPGKVNLYVGKECVEKGVPQAIADQKLIELIRAHGKWVDPPALPASGGASNGHAHPAPVGAAILA
ncbi:MAG TPA: flavodoxin-dependent (E)-4-hydroxy-3-methylbut-2-enyl-diphosphate synthase, partial [Chloroflexota bacterium]|nr:flavodoxin-dependent (E)-4-hydroxy-3-methylbut-2-enyl-diphosphate synthase [Chloroflexota bacterium]